MDAFNVLIRPSFQPAEEAVVRELPDSWSDASSGEAPARVVEWMRREDETLRLFTRAEQQAFLVLNDGWFPGWEAAVDGAPTPILQTNVLCRGIVVPAGVHEISFVYRPAALRIGAAISATSLLLFGALLLATSVRRG
jgi:uncharacterized membrane protein YfhO